MAFCTVCGATVIGKFCSKCGAPAATAGTGPAVAIPTPPDDTIPAKRKTSPIVWILIAVLGLGALCTVAVVAVGAIFMHRARVGGVVFDRSGDGGLSIRSRDGKVEFGTLGRAPSWVPEYPGSHPTFAVRAGSDDGGQGGNFTFSTADASSKVLTFYEDKCRDLGMRVELTSSGGDSGMIVATDQDRRSVTVVVGAGSGQTTVNVTYGRK